MKIRRSPLVLGMLISAAFVTGCTSGTTYGTGTTHEAQTFEGLTNILSLKNKDQPKIDYSARPDLVMPADVAALPQPLEDEASTSSPDWPESPEQRIARVRGEAVEPDPRSGELPVEELLRKKEGLTIRSGKVSKNPDRDGNAFIDNIRDDANGVSESEIVKKRRAELSYSTGPQRRFLTEPPVEYRTPAATAVAGDLGYSREELIEQEKEQKKREKAEKTGHWIE